MVTIIKKGSSKDTIQKASQGLKRRKGLNAYKYCGIISLKEDPLKIQKKMRNEWK